MSGMAGLEPLPFKLKWSVTTGVLYWGFLLMTHPDLVLTPGPSVVDTVSTTWPVLAAAIIVAVPTTFVLSLVYWEVRDSR